MVRFLRLFAAIIAFLLPLGSCDVLFNGVFPPSVAQATARADLSTSIAGSPAGYFSLSTVTAAGNEYVILFTSFNFDSSRPHLLIMDPHLNVLSSYTLGELGTVAPGGTFSGRVTMTDVNDQVVIGNVFFDVLPSGLLTTVANHNNVSLDGPSITILPVDGLFHETNYRISPPSLAWTEYGSGWNTPGTFSCTLGAPTQSLRIVTIFEDRDSSSTPDVFVFQDDGSQQTYFARVPKADIDVDLTVAVPDFFKHYGGSITTKSNLASESIAISRAGVIAYDYRKDALIRFTLDAPDTVSTLPFKWIHGMQAAAGMSGTYCVVWDPVSRTLTRYEQWW